MALGEYAQMLARQPLQFALAPLRARTFAPSNIRSIIRRATAIATVAPE